MRNLALVKLGGSVVTFKDRPLAANVGAISDISAILARLKIPIMIVHGGGSFGHYWSVKYDMHTRPDRYDTHGIAVVHESMIALNQIIVHSMLENGMNPYGFVPSVFVSNQRPDTKKIKNLHAIADSGIVPVTFGDVVHVQKGKYSILSGDVIMSMLAKVLRPSKVVFATNVDGIYKNMDSKELVREIRASKNIKFAAASGADVTGGMKRKVTEAFKIASAGIDVLMVNGLKPERIADAIEGSPDLVGTKIMSGRKK